MKMGLVGQKLGMTRIFHDDGTAVAVTVIEVKPNVISQIKLQATDGYDAVQVSIGEKKKSRLTKGVAGHFVKANISSGFLTKEFRLAEGEVSRYSVGDAFGVALFSEGQKVDVRGRSVGKGFAGTIKRHHFSGQRKTHGNSLSHRVPGSIGQNQTPGRVFKGKKMSGHLGNVMRSVQNLEIIRIDGEHNLLLIKGAVPGAKGGYIVIRPSVKS
ncbi:50S ribosomal protein L3 [Cardiobacterium sp. Marseille-Q4385]|jgi:50S ribosomal protein L3|uniref:50S ribosomal protein L3 n=1 Tax=Cardiobacterium sp. Marseille-Q4385 TaxID=2866573 RepID=UPI001CE424F4|nr:50S ribosomal protein L3 [Cardiobacterium sp. Marseille-Q4385]